jgi:hypothetical protein
MKFAFVRMLIGLVTCGAMFAAEPAGAPESTVSAAAAATPVVNRPPYHFLRQNENWSAIAESPAQDCYDPI